MINSHLNVNACLTPLCSVDGKHVITIEGLGDHKNPHPVQERIALCYGYASFFTLQIMICFSPTAIGSNVTTNYLL